MKKTLLIICMAIMILMLASCNSSEIKSNNTFTSLSDNEILTVGSQRVRYMNYQTENTTVSTLTYPIYITYRLNRSYYSDYTNSVKYGDYYYYWSTDETTNESVELGHKTTKTTHTYAYLPYLENEGVSIKETIVTEVSFDHEGGWIEKETEVNIILNGYFASFDAIKSVCPELAAKIDTNTTRKYYVDVTIPDDIITNRQFYDSYYYIEKK